MAPKIVDKEEKKSQIRNVAMTLFGSKGVQQTTMAEIANAAGIGKGTIYEYWTSKDEIFVSSFNHFFEVMSQDIITALSHSADPVDKIKILISESFRSINKAGHEFTCILMEFWAESIRRHDDSLVTEIDMIGIYHEYRTLLAGFIKEGIKQGKIIKTDPNALASLLIGTLDGISLQWFFDKEAVHMKNVEKVIMETFINGFLIPEEK